MDRQLRKWSLSVTLLYRTRCSKNTRVAYSFDSRVWQADGQADRQTEGQIGKQTDRGRIKLSICVALLRRQHKKLFKIIHSVVSMSIEDFYTNSHQQFVPTVLWTIFVKVLSVFCTGLVECFVLLIYDPKNHQFLGSIAGRLIGLKSNILKLNKLLFTVNIFLSGIIETIFNLNHSTVKVGHIRQTPIEIKTSCYNQNTCKYEVCTTLYCCDLS